MRKWILLVAGLAFGPGGLVGPRPAAAQTAPVPVALSGTAAPAGGNYTNFNNPVLNGSGQVTFYAGLTSGPIPGGIFVGVPGAVQAAALEGTAAPAGGNYSSILSFPVLNGSGQVALQAILTGGSSTRGVFVGAPGSIQAAALQNTAAPAGGNYNTFNTSPVLNGSGQVAFFAGLTGGSSSQGVFVGAPGAVQAAALQGTAAPAGGNYSGFNVSPVLNGSGQVAFTATLTGGSSTQGVFVGAPGAVQAAALQGTAAPAGGNYAGFTAFPIPGLNGSGQVAFHALLAGGSSSTGVFVGTPGAVQAAALNNTAAPGGGTYSGLGTPALNGAGQVAFGAEMTGGSSTSGVFVGAPGAVQAAALQGTAAPAGGNYDGFLNNPTLNGSGQVAFRASLTGAGVTTANDQGLYAGSVGGLVKVVREGDQVDVDPGAGIDLRIVAGISFLTGSGGQDGRGVSFSDSGFVAYRLTFSDASSGVFLSFIPVPEPTTVGLVAVAGLAAIGWLRRRGSSVLKSPLNNRLFVITPPSRVTSALGRNFRTAATSGSEFVP